MDVDPGTLAEVVRRIVAHLRPVRVILFGSAARGEMREDSDLDVLVVMPEGCHRRRTAQLLQPVMAGIPVPVDIKVATTGDLERHGDNPGLVYHSILEEGLELYAG